MCIQRLWWMHRINNRWVVLGRNSNEFVSLIVIRQARERSIWEIAGWILEILTIVTYLWLVWLDLLQRNVKIGIFSEFWRNEDYKRYCDAQIFFYRLKILKIPQKIELLTPSSSLFHVIYKVLLTKEPYNFKKS